MSEIAEIGDIIDAVFSNLTSDMSSISDKSWKNKKGSIFQFSWSLFVLAGQVKTGQASQHGNLGQISEEWTLFRVSLTSIGKWREIGWGFGKTASMCFTINQWSAVTSHFKKDSALVWDLGRVARKFEAVFFHELSFLSSYCYNIGLYPIHIIFAEWMKHARPFTYFLDNKEKDGRYSTRKFQSLIQHQFYVFHQNSGKTVCFF